MTHTARLLILALCLFAAAVSLQASESSREGAAQASEAQPQLAASAASAAEEPREAATLDLETVALETADLETAGLEALGLEDPLLLSSPGTPLECEALCDPALRACLADCRSPGGPPCPTCFQTYNYCYYNCLCDPAGPCPPPSP